MKEKVSVVVRPECEFEKLAESLSKAGWDRSASSPATPSILPGEPELAQWRHKSDETTLTYTFNPVAGLRVLQLSGPGGETLETLSSQLPVMTAEELPDALSSSDERQVLHAILAAAELEAVDLAGPIGLLAAHREPSVAESAARVHLDLLHAKAFGLAETDRFEELNETLQAICGNALPLLSALPSASPDEILGLQPMEEDCHAALAENLAAKVFAAYDKLWEDPPSVLPGPDRQNLRIHACPTPLLASDNPFSRPFPTGYRDITCHLRRDCVWLAWRYCRPDSDTGLAFNGLVHVRGHWVWFPKVFRVIGQVLLENE